MAIALKTGTYDFIQALFLRDVDPQFSKEHYITVQTLDYFYQENVSIPKLEEQRCMGFPRGTRGKCAHGF